jgi:hypothetical protein
VPELAENKKVVHINSWEEFKRKAIALHPEFIAYTVQSAPLSKPPIGLRLVFSAQDVQYVFLDFAHGDTFKQTKLSVYTTKSGDAYFREEDLKNFIQTELNRKDISVVSFEVLGY